MCGPCGTHEKMTDAYKIWVEMLEGRNNSEDLDIDGRTMLKLILGKWNWRGLD